MIEAIEEFIEAVKEIAEALIDFLSSIACLVIDAALATLGGILDGLLMVAFPPLLTLATTNPMCLFKIPMKLKVDPSKMPKLAAKQKKLEQKWSKRYDKAQKRKACGAYRCRRPPY